MTPAGPGYYIDGVLGGDRRALSRAITLVESSRADHQALARTVLEALLPHTGRAWRLGVSGVPGAGKSTFIEALGLKLINDKGLSVAVLAIDPTSGISGGSVLGDRTRMEGLSAHPRAFIRPSPSGGTLGGVAAKTREALLLCEAFGFDLVLVETVGVGQSETAVHSLVDCFLLLMIAGGGDQLQGIKKGILELADVIAINKADGDGKTRAEAAQRELEAALHLVRPAECGWSPPVLTVSSLEGLGLDALWETVTSHRDLMEAGGYLEGRRRRQAVDWLGALVKDGLWREFTARADIQAALARLTQRVDQGSTTPTAAADELLGLWSGRRSPTPGDGA